MFLLSLPKDILFLAKNGISPSEIENMTNFDYELTLAKAEESEQNKTKHITNASNTGNGFSEFENMIDPIAAMINSVAHKDRK